MKEQGFMRSRILRLAMTIGCGATLLAGASEKSDKTDAPVYQSAAKRRVRLGGVMVGASYSHTNGYPYGGYYPYGYYSPFWGYGSYWSSMYSPFWYSPVYGPWFHPGAYSGYAYSPGMGELKLPTKSKTAAVYIDGAFAGSADKLKRFWLEPGAYNIEVRDNNQTAIKERVYVLSGKTITLQAGKRE
jgi:hypothetical protein